MVSRPVAVKFAMASLTLGMLGWTLYILQWCFDLTIGLLLATVSAGLSTICASVMDFLPLVLWLVGIVTGHLALGQIKHTGVPGRRQAVWGLVLGYLGLFFTILLIVVIVALIASGIGVGLLDKILPSLPKH
jgi:hypothetical protein